MTYGAPYGAPFFLDPDLDNDFLDRGGRVKRDPRHMGILWQEQGKIAILQGQEISCSMEG